MAVKVTGNILKTARNIYAGADKALSAMGVDIMRLAKTQVPVSAGGGQLKSSGIIRKRGEFKYELSFNKEYAAYQHRGMRADGSRVVQNYTYPTSKKHYLKDPAKLILEKKENYFKRYVKII